MSHQIDSLAYSNHLRGLPPAHKLSFAIVLLIISLLAQPVVQLLIAVWLTVWIVIYAGVPKSIYFRLLSLPLGFWLTSLPAFVINGVSLNQSQMISWDVWDNLGMVIGQFYLYVSQTGLHQSSILFTRIVASVSCVYLILLTIPFTEVLQTLRKLKCPVLLIELMLFMYRFIFTLFAIADELWIAQNARGGYRTWRRGMHSLGILIGQLLQRTLETYRQVSLSLASRGFNGELRVWHSYPYQASRRYMLEAIGGCTFLIVLSVFLH